MKNYHSLKDAASILQKQPYQLTYLMTTGKVAEPQRIGGKRVFTIDDLRRIADQLGIDNLEELLKRHRGNDDQ